MKKTHHNLLYILTNCNVFFLYFSSYSLWDNWRCTHKIRHTNVSHLYWLVFELHTTGTHVWPRHAINLSKKKYMSNFMRTYKIKHSLTAWIGKLPKKRTSTLVFKICQPKTLVIDSGLLDSYYMH